jgi:NAD(P)-dependent dehydrogenase (short-subunit alcohol dehydrogenase family)
MARRVAITGAGAGIGRAIAQAFVELGDEVYIGDVSQQRLTEVAQALGSGVRTQLLDVTDQVAMDAFVADAAGPDGLDVFVNNAGIFDGYAGISETSAELWNKIISVNLTGYFHGCKAAAEPMMRQRRGRIINVGSIAGQRGSADGLAYSASKAGIEGMTRRLAVDVGPFGVTANVVAPGVTKTDIRANSREQLGHLVDMDRGVGASQELSDFLIPAHRPGQSEEIAAVVTFLASDPAGYVNGQVLHVDGGWSAT